jgi:predicted PurR-regulated permease PerM
MKSAPSSEVTRIVLLVLLIGLLLVGSFWTLLPFLGALLWAATVVIATWPGLVWIEHRSGGRRGVATTVMTLLVLFAFVVPLWLAVSTLIDAANSTPALLHDFAARGLGSPPAWVAKIPLAGDQLTAKWQELSTGGPEALVEYVKPYTRSAATWVLSLTGGIGAMIVNILLIIILVAILYSQGQIAAKGALAFGHRIGGERGEQTIVLASQAVRSVALGVVVTALVQSILAGIGLWVCGVPHAGVLTALVFVFGIAQIGPLPIMAGAVIWLYASDSNVWGTVLLIWSIPVGALDNVLRPILIRRGVQLPMLLIIAGVIGGLIAFGVLGLFVGPVILAATYTLAKAWVTETPPASDA